MKSKFRSLLLGLLGAFAAWAVPIAGVHAATVVNIGEWNVFSFGTAGSEFGDCGGECDTLGYPTPAPPWQVTVGAAGATLIFVDGFQAGDAFSITVSGLANPITTVDGTGTGSTACFSATDCLLDSSFDRVGIYLTAGTYTIDGTVTASPFFSGAAFFGVLAGNRINGGTGNLGNTGDVICSLTSSNPAICGDRALPSEPSPWVEVRGNPALSLIPEPASLALLGLALVMVGGIRRGTRSH